jgi:transcriptional regulator with XRE-family HTH domain
LGGLRHVRVLPAGLCGMGSTLAWARSIPKSRRRKKAAFMASSEPAETDDLTTGSNAPPEPERTLERAIGTQIRDLRQRFHLSAGHLANAASISTGMLSKIENGQISASLSTLQALAQALNVPITNLFAAFEEKRDCSFVKAGQGVAIERRGSKVGHVYQLLGHALGGEVVMEPYLITLKEEAVAYTGFRHAGIELIYMLSGKVVYRHGDETYPLGPGDSLMFDSAALHGPETVVERPATYLSIIVYRASPI